MHLIQRTFLNTQLSNTELCGETKAYYEFCDCLVDWKLQCTASAPRERVSISCLLGKGPKFNLQSVVSEECALLLYRRRAEKMQVKMLSQDYLSVPGRSNGQ